MIHLSQIVIYPVKSLRGISVEAATVERRGLTFDRRWMLVDEQNRFLTQREFPRMATIATAVSPDGLRLEHTDAGSITVTPADLAGKQVIATVWSSRCKVDEYRDGINQWFSDVLGTHCRLVYMPEKTKRPVNYWYRVNRDDHVSFADGYPFLLIGQASLDDLNSRLASPVPMDRFRPNFVVEGSEPFAEDTWKRFTIGNGGFRRAKPCARCVITTIDQHTGRKGTEPLTTLAGFRSKRPRGQTKVLFGQNLIAEEAGGTVAVGDPVRVIE